MSQYLNPTDPGAFRDIPTKAPPGERWSDMTAYNTVCPLCLGHGKWNLRLDAYGGGRHFQAHCCQCNGYGWVRDGSLNATCIHEETELSSSECRAAGVPHYGMCWHVYRCTKCGHIRSVDSSD